MDINVVTPEQLELAYEIDSTRAQAIIRRRDDLGGFTSWDQIERELESLLDQATLATMRQAGLTIGGGGREVRTDDYRGLVRERLRANADKNTSHGTHQMPSPHQPGGSARLDLNQATADDLVRKFQVDTQRAESVIRTREELGRFTSWDQVKQVPGLGGQTVEELEQDGLYIGSPRRNRGRSKDL